MTPLKTLQTDSARADDLFSQLAETSPGAVKARERLFGELKEEITLLARLEHDHLLPVLKKHAGTKTVVAQTGGRLKELNALLRRLEGAPKEGDDFLVQVNELKAAFQEHLREEKSALLPKVQKALSDEEVQAVAERVEIDRAEVEATARHEAEVQRAEARRLREKEAARVAAAEEAEREARRVAREERAAAQAAELKAREREEAMRAEARRVAREEREAAQAAERRAREREEMIRAEAEASERQARRLAREERAAAQAAERDAREAARQTALAVAAPVETARAGAGAVLRAVAGTAQRGLEQAAELVGASGERTSGLSAMTQGGTAWLTAAQAASSAWSDWAGKRVENQVAGLGALMQCRSALEVMALQGRMVRQDVELLLETGARVSGIGASAAQDAARAVSREG
jgi:hypothetical protein